MSVSELERTTSGDMMQGDAARWRALSARDANADGTFVYSVKTTGVYCRPSCASRRAKPMNVAFHATCEDAEAAGFRPCRRCRPNEAAHERRHARAIEAACRAIEEAETPPSLDDLARIANLSAFHFHRVFKKATGVTPKAYADARRAIRVESGLRSARTVTEAVFDAGYNASSRFYAQADRRLGMSPTAYRKGGTGAEIRFAVAQCSLGALMVAATEKGICAIMLGDEPDPLLRALQDRFPKATLIGADPGFESVVAQVVGLVEQPHRTFDLPLDIGGTAFQQRVWEALRKIPLGRTASYAEIARAVGKPAAVRAVARACGANLIAVAVPCHRVIGSNGALTGYRWGIERKRTLLLREGAGAAAK